MDKLSIRKEAARIAAQVEGVTTRNFTAMARRIEHYIMGSAKLPEHFSENTAMEKNFRQCQIGLAEANHYMENMIVTQNLEKNLRETQPGTPLSKGIGEIYTPPQYHAVNRQHDPTFVRDLMKTFAEYPSTHEDFNEAARQRHELFHDLGLEPEPFDKRHPNPPCDTDQETVYLAPGGMPSSEAESIYLQENGDKVE